MTSAANVPGEEHLFGVLFATNYSITHAEAKKTTAAAVGELFEGQASTSNNTGSEPADCGMDFRAFVDHNSVIRRQNPDQLRDNIVHDIYALQGRKSTWITGGLWSADYTDNVWASQSRCCRDCGQV